MGTKESRQSGFSYIDVMIAIVILMVGVLAMVSALAANLVRSYESEKRVVAKQLALSSIESIISAKEIKRPGVIEGWKSIRNVVANPPVGEVNGIFLTGFNPVRVEMGADGVAGTADDACASTGPCQVSGEPDNVSAVIPGFERQIVITDIDDPERPSPINEIKRRRIDVTIRYFVNRLVRNETVSTIVTDYYQ